MISRMMKMYSKGKGEVGSRCGCINNGSKQKARPKGVNLKVH